MEECVFRDCVIHATTAQGNLDFDTTIFERCKFTGEFPGCDFGARSTPNGKTRGTIKDCDLREAILDIVGFSNCDLSTLKLPRWPHFTITNPTATCPLIPNPVQLPRNRNHKRGRKRPNAIHQGGHLLRPPLLPETLYDEKQLRQLLDSRARDHSLGQHSARRLAIQHPFFALPTLPITAHTDSRLQDTSHAVSSETHHDLHPRLLGGGAGCTGAHVPIAAEL